LLRGSSRFAEVQAFEQDFAATPWERPRGVATDDTLALDLNARP